MRPSSTFLALRNPDYRLLWFGALGAFGGTQIFFLARGYLAYELTGSAAVLGVVTLAQGVPMLLLSLVGGVVADRVQKRKLLFGTQTGLILIGLIAALLTSSGYIEVWHLVALGVAQGAVFSFNGPSRQAYMIELIKPEELPNAIALFNSTPMSMRIIAPSVAGILISLPFIGTTYIFYVVTALYLLPHLMLFKIKTPPRIVSRKKTAMAADFAEGVRYIVGHPVLRLLVIAALLPMLIGNSYNNLLPVFASEDVLDVGASGLGLMSTFAGIGSLVGSLIIASMAHIPKRGLIQAGCGAVLGIGLMLFGLASSFPVALACLLLAGLAGAGFQTLNSSMMMATADPAYYGRVSSINQLNFSLSNMAVLPLGVLVDQAGAPAVMVGSGAFVVLFWLFVVLFVKSYRQIESVASPGDVAADEPAKPSAVEAFTSGGTRSASARR